MRVISPLRRFKQIALQFLGSLAFSDPDVAEALRLTSEQKKPIRAIQDQTPSAAMKLGPPGGDPRKPAPSRWDDLKRRELDAREQILDLLTPDQGWTWEELVGEPFKGEPRPGPPPRKMNGISSSLHAGHSSHALETGVGQAGFTTGSFGPISLQEGGDPC